MAHEHRFERPARRGRIDDTGGDAEGGTEALLPPHRCSPRTTPATATSSSSSSRAFLEGYYYKPRVDWELLERHHEGSSPPPAASAATCCSRCCRATTRGALEKAAPAPGHLRARQPLRRAAGPRHPRRSASTNPQLLEIARKLGAPLLATNDSHYTHRDDAVAHDALLCVQTGALMSDPNRFKFDGDEHYLKSARRDAPPVPRGARGVRQHAAGSPSGPNVEIEFGKPQLPELPAARGLRRRRRLPPRTSPSRAPTQRWGDAAPDDVRRAPRLRARGHRATWGSASYFLDRLGPHPARPRRRHPGRPGPGQRGRLRGGLLPAHHRPRPDPLRPAVRALPQPEPHLDARHRHGLRLPLPGRDDPLRGRALRPRPRRADRHVLHDQGPGRGARRRPRARLPVRGRRQGRQGHAAAGHGPRHAAARLPRASTPSYDDGYKMAAELRGDVRRPTPTPSRSSTSPGASRACAARTASTPPRW